MARILGFKQRGKRIAVSNQRTRLFLSIRRTGEALVRLRAHDSGSASHSGVRGCAEVRETRHFGDRNTSVILSGVRTSRSEVLTQSKDPDDDCCENGIEGHFSRGFIERTP